MSPTNSPRPTADRNLLFGILALQMDFISRDALIQAMHAWVLEKNKPLGHILRQYGALREDTLALLEVLVEKHLELHGHNPQQSLAAVATPVSVPQELHNLADADVQASLDGAAASSVLDPGATGPYQPQTEAAGRGLRYRVLRPHAKGGLGEVFVAEDQELHREVALKEIRPHQAQDPYSRSRFLLEAEITGRLEHPAIVPVYGLGCYEDGRPFYAMRLIQGVTFKEAIGRFHDGPDRAQKPGARILALRKLLTQFVTVCNAVAYAHSRGVLNRDIKDDNIMLGPFAETLVIDWGLAKVRGDPGRGRSAESELPPPSLTPHVASLPETQMGTVLGTPAYLSPEAASGRLDLIGPASDIYSLGATLYKVLTGRPPIEGTDRGEVLRQASRGDWRPPRQVNKDVPAALDAICRKAMAFTPADRYSSALELAADVEHWLADEPISAYKEGWPMRLGRWSRRHRPLVSAALALLLTAVAGLAVGLVAVEQEKGRTQQALAAERQRRQQARQALDAMSSQLIEEWLGQQKVLRPEHKEFLHKALASYEEFARDTRQDEESRAGVAAASQRVGNIYQTLGQAAEAEAAYRRGAALHAQLAADFPDRADYREHLAQCHNSLGALLVGIGRPKEAEKAYREALAQQKQLAADFPNRLDFRKGLAASHNNLGLLLNDTGRTKEAKRAYDEGIQIQKQLVADFPDTPEFRHDLAASYINLGTLLLGIGRPQEAETTLHEALTLQKQLATDSPDRPDFRQRLALCHNNLAALLQATGRPKEAETAYREALTLRKQLAAVFPNRPDFRSDLAESFNNLGALLAENGRLEEAETTFRDALTLFKQLAAEFPQRSDFRQHLAASYGNLGSSLQDQGRPRQAEPMFREALPLYKQLATEFPNQPEFRMQLVQAHNNLGSMLHAVGRLKEAEAAHREALALVKQLAADFPNVPDYQAHWANTLGGLAEVARTQHRDAEACDFLKEAWTLLQAALRINPHHPLYRAVAANNRKTLAQSRLSLGEHAAAAAAADEMLAIGADPANDAYNAGCLLAQCVPLAQKDAKLSPPQREELARGYANRAMAALRQAVTKGYKDAAHMKEDKDLDPLRPRADFQKFLAELPKAAPADKTRNGK